MLISGSMFWSTVLTQACWYWVQKAAGMHSGYLFFYGCHAYTDIEFFSVVKSGGQRLLSGDGKRKSWFIYCKVRLGGAAVRGSHYGHNFSVG